MVFPLWAGAVQKYLAKIKMTHKGASPYHSRTNGKVESLNGALGRMLTKLLGKSIKLWDMYLDQALFCISGSNACHNEDITVLSGL
jgi:hypothetical protein